MEQAFTLGQNVTHPMVTGVGQVLEVTTTVNGSARYKVQFEGDNGNKLTIESDGANLEAVEE